MSCWFIFHDWAKWTFVAKETTDCYMDGYQNGQIKREIYRRECKKCGHVKYKRIVVADTRHIIF